MLTHLRIKYVLTMFFLLAALTQGCGGTILYYSRDGKGAVMFTVSQLDGVRNGELESKYNEKPDGSVKFSISAKQKVDEKTAKAIVDYAGWAVLTAQIGKALSDLAKALTGGKGLEPIVRPPPAEVPVAP